MSTDDAQPPRVAWDAPGGRVVCSGDWTRAGLSRGMPWAPAGVGAAARLDTGGVERLDSAGALALARLVKTLESRGCRVDRSGVDDGHGRLLDLIADNVLPQPARTARPHALFRLGAGTTAAVARLLAFLAFIGAVAVDSGPRLLRPGRLRWRQIAGEIEHAGVRALGILGLLTFLTGVVIAYQGGAPLQQYGANIFLVELLTLTMLREMAPLMTAIIVAGRTGSSYTAQIGTMHITEEVAALRAIGITPYEMLVLPKLLALVVAMPLLTIFADLLGMLGGITVASTLFGVGPGEFIQRIPEAVAPSTFWVGIAKAPVFAVLIVAVSCYHGFSVQGSTEAVGRATTQSVVQGIFLVIVADAAFSVIFNWLDL